MDSSGELPGELAPGHVVDRPAAPPGAIVLASPHSGRRYPPDLLRASRLDPLTLRRSEDCFVDELFAEAARLGAPMIRAHFPRAYVDLNREPWELDPAMFDGPLPDFCNTRSPRVQAGLGTIARIVASGADIYARKLTVAEGLERIRRLYQPYHRDLAALVEERRRAVGHAILIDCHSMPSTGGPMDLDPGRRRADFILGDIHGNACAAAVADTVAAALRGFGYRVTHNAPYAGGFTTAHYGRPAEGVHALQIEVNRDLYMDEARYARKPELARIAGELRQVVDRLARIDPRQLTQ
ncbi:N-formylglutamate amidohydrolase [Stella sp.]|uniref:N-formylglutamate amidohydrolase n=1 Tax=Stella sp. TaxID=2912054 RepID=UPI0035B0B8DD